MHASANPWQAGRLRLRRMPGGLIQDIDRAKWIKKLKVKDLAAVNLFVSELGQGESEVLLLLLLAKQRDLIQSIKPLFEKFIDKNFRYPIQISWYLTKMVRENQKKFKKAPLGVDKMINEIIMKM